METGLSSKVRDAHGVSCRSCESVDGSSRVEEQGIGDYFGNIEGVQGRLSLVAYRFCIRVLTLDVAVRRAAKRLGSVRAKETGALSSERYIFRGAGHADGGSGRRGKCSCEAITTN